MIVSLDLEEVALGIVGIPVDVGIVARPTTAFVHQRCEKETPKKERGSLHMELRRVIAVFRKRSAKSAILACGDEVTEVGLLR